MFNLQVVTSKPVAERLLEKAKVEKAKIEKVLSNSIIQSYGSSQSLKSKQEDKDEWEAGLAKATAAVNSLPEGTEKEKAKNDQLEFQWRLGRLALKPEALDPEDVIWSQFDKSIAMVCLPVAEQLVSELSTLKDSLPD